MIDNKDKALKLALEALVAAFQGKDKTGQVTDAITAIREALAEQPAQDEDQAHYKQVVDGVREVFDAKRKQQPAQQPAQQQEPVACDCKLKADECDGKTATFHPFQVGASCATRPCERTWTSPPASKPWVGLTNEEMLAVVHYSQLDNARAIEAKIKEKNNG